MHKILGAAVAVAVINIAAIPAGTAATDAAGATTSAPAPKDLGVPRPRIPPVRIITSDVGHETKMAYVCTYQYVLDYWGNYVYRYVCF